MWLDLLVYTILRTGDRVVRRKGDTFGRVSDVERRRNFEMV
jgi:hypothetical protein